MPLQRRWLLRKLSGARLLVMDRNPFTFWMTFVGTLCWAVCFWWMYRISAKQNDLLEKLGEQGKRIEKLSKMEHDLIKEVHPQVNEIREGMEEMMATAKENHEDSSAPSKEKKRSFRPRQIRENTKMDIVEQLKASNPMLILPLLVRLRYSSL